ncbi:MAG: molybdenum cofactor biosynthesis protein [Actinomycetia bacterium]|nr:molybdenum cofactor biosynthesis protein [Actinomycetes bacterium]
MEPLVDSYGRVHRDLRISVTDRCNFRCTYCMPEEGMPWVPREDVLTFEEIERVARIAVERFGVDSIRLTGGEPTVRAHLPVLVERLARLGVDLSMTTNGATLRSSAADLLAAGLQRVNISIDSLRRDRFQELTRRDELDHVLDGIDAAIEVGFAPVKVNVVCMEGVNDDEIVDFAAFGRERGVEVRFIEFMPLDGGHTWERASVVPGERIIQVIGAVHELRPVARDHEPAALWEYVDGRGRVGVIPSVTEPFCATCDRVRLTAEGKLRACLFSIEETDLRGLLRGDAGDDAVAAAIAGCVAGKWAGHRIGSVTFVQPPRSMSQIGG